MIFRKTFLFGLLTLSLSQAGLSQTAQTNKSPNMPNGGGSSKESNVLKEKLDIFLAELPQNPGQAIEYIFAKINRAEDKPVGRNMEFIINVVDQFTDGRVVDLNPRFGQDNSLIFELTMKKSLMNNPVYMLEIMTSLEHLLSGNHSYQLFSLNKKKESYPHSYKNDQGLTVYDITKMIHEYTDVEVIHSAFHALGIRLPPQVIEMHPLTWAELQINALKGSAYAARELYSLEVEAAKTAMNNYQSFSMTKSLTEAERREFVLQIAAEKGIKLDQSLSEQSLAAAYFSKKKYRTNN